MRRRLVVTVFTLAALIGASAGAQTTTSGPATTGPDRPEGWELNWPKFRGPGEDGRSPGDPPALIDLAKDVRYKVAVPADGNSSPIVWGERIYITGEGWRVMAFDRASGKLLWNTQLRPPEAVTLPDGEDELPAQTEDTGMAAGTPCTDGKRVYASFGDGVLGCVDADGRQVWATRLFAGKPKNSFGLASSPVPYGDLVIQVVDMGRDPEEGLSFVVAFRAKDGVEVWRTDRPVTSSWSTPAITRVGDRDELITTATPLIIAYQPATGVELWRAEGIAGDVAACPVVCGSLVIAPAGESQELFAYRPGGDGNVTKTHLAWKKKLPMPDVASPVCDSRRYYHVSVTGDLICLDAATGDEKWTPKEMPGMFWASPVLAAGRIYLANRDGGFYAVSAGDGKTLFEVKLGEKVVATPAIVGNRIYIRAAKHLICLGKP